MSLEWKESRVKKGRETIRVTHWSKHRAEDLLSALSRKPVRRKGNHPEVRVYKFGQRELAVRDLPSITDAHYSAQTIFPTLVKTVNRKAAVVEMPVAFIRHNGKKLLVSLWKKNTRNIGEVLEDDSIPLKTRLRTCYSAVRKLAQLHAAGFIHGHIKLENFVADTKGNAFLIDPTRIRKGREFNDDFLLHLPIHLVGKLQSELLRHGRLTGWIRDDLRREYHRVFEKYSKKYKKS